MASGGLCGRCILNKYCVFINCPNSGCNIVTAFEKLAYLFFFDEIVDHSNTILWPIIYFSLEKLVPILFWNSKHSIAIITQYRPWSVGSYGNPLIWFCTDEHIEWILYRKGFKDFSELSPCYWKTSQLEFPSKFISCKRATLTLSFKMPTLMRGRWNYRP